MPGDDGILDVAIVGGGVSGVYAGWRLLTAEPRNGQGEQGRQERPASVVLFEMSDRIGGRLLSVTPPGMPHVHCELGGMRFMTSQPLVSGLVEWLGLQTRVLPADEPENLAYLRGRHLRTADLTDPHKLPYNLDWSERGHGAGGDLLFYVVDQLIPGIKNLHGQELAALLREFKFEGRNLYNWGFWNLLARAMSREAYFFAQQTLGYDTAGLNWNAADTILLNFDFMPGTQYLTCVDGYEQLPRTVCRLFEEAGGEVRMQSALKAFDWEEESGTVRLTFANDREPVRARALILAMPRRSLELLDQTGAVLDPQQNPPIQGLLRSVVPIPLFKAFVCYHYPWWTTVGPTQGRSLTDLPLRQVYYWGVEGQQPGADPQNQNAVLMATYDDSLNVDFWAGLRNESEQPHFETRHNRFLHTHAGSPEWNDHRAPAPMVEELHRQVVEMHGLRFAPPPYAAAFRDWGDDPYGGGVNFWKIHQKSWEVIPRVANPRPGIPVYITGEAYSNGQGWVEGALETAELVLQDHFHLAPPQWVPQ